MMIGAVKLAYYQQQDWKRFLEIIDDRKSMHDTWEEWHNAYRKTKKTLISNGFVVEDFVVDLDRLIEFCKREGIKNDGRARSRFVS